MIPYRVERFSKKHNNWIKVSSHKNLEFAEINAKVIHKLKYCDVRIINKGDILQFYSKDVSYD